MALLTNYTYSKLCTSIEIDFNISLEQFIRTIYPSPELYYILNSREISYLFKYANILDDEKKFTTEYYDFVPEKIDHKNFVNEKAGKLSFHLNRDCEFLSKDFKDFYIPDDIKELGDNVIAEYRDWFKKNEFYSRFFNNEIGLDVIIMRFNNEFPKKYGFPPLNEDFKLLQEIPNSKDTFVKDAFDIKNCEMQINELIRRFDDTFTSFDQRKLSKFSNKHDSEIEGLRALLEKMFGVDVVKIKGLDWVRAQLLKGKELKNQLITLVLEYVRWTKGFASKDFDVASLEKFGLKCCYSCKQEEKKV